MIWKFLFLESLISAHDHNSRLMNEHYFYRHLQKESQRGSASHCSLKSSRPIIILLISLVPAPISQSLASLRRRPVGYSFTQPFPPKHCIACKIGRLKNVNRRTKAVTVTHVSNLNLPAMQPELLFQLHKVLLQHNPEISRMKNMEEFYKQKIIYLKSSIMMLTCSRKGKIIT